MSPLDDVPPPVLADAMEKLVSKMDEQELADILASHVQRMPLAARDALIESIFDVFRDRGESSEDAAEEAGTALDALRAHDDAALTKLLQYGVASTGVLKAAMELFAEEYPQQLPMLPPALVEQLSQRLSQGA